MIQSNDNNIMLLKEELLNKTDSQSKEEYVQAVQNYFHDRYWSANYSFTELFIHQGNSYSIEPRTFSALEALDVAMLDTLSASNLFIALMRANNIPSKIILGYSTKIQYYIFWPEIYLDGTWKEVSLNDRNYGDRIILAEGKDVLEDIPELIGGSIVNIKEVDSSVKLNGDQTKELNYIITGQTEDFYNYEAMNSYPQTITEKKDKTLRITTMIPEYDEPFDYRLDEYKQDRELNRYIEDTDGIKLDEASELMYNFEEINDLEELILSSFRWMQQNISYDDELAKEYTFGRKARSIQEILDSKTAVCSDYAALFAVILRNKDVPVKIIRGMAIYQNEEGLYYGTAHAWNEVYSYKAKKWIAVDPQASCIQVPSYYIKYYSGVDYTEISNGIHSLVIQNISRSRIEIGK